MNPPPSNEIFVCLYENSCALYMIPEYKYQTTYNFTIQSTWRTNAITSLRAFDGNHSNSNHFVLYTYKSIISNGALSLLSLIVVVFLVFQFLFIYFVLFKFQLHDEHCTMHNAHCQFNEKKTGSNSRISSRQNGKFIGRKTLFYFVCAIN